MKRLFKTVLIFILLLSLVACGDSTPSEKVIMEDLDTYFKDYLGSENEIESVEVEKSKTDDDLGYYTAWVRANSKNEEKEVEEVYVMTYEKFDKEYLIYDIYLDSDSEIKVSPLKGADEEDIRVALRDVKIDLEDGETWTLTKDVIDEIEIEDQNTDLESKKDKVLVSVKGQSGLMKASGKINLDFVFNKNGNYGWDLDGYKVAEKFETEVDSEEDLKLEAKDFEEKLLGQTLTYGDGYVLEIKNEDLENLKISEPEISENGTVKNYNFETTFDKGLATLKVDGNITYRYDKMGGWTEENFEYFGEFIDFDLVGNWVGSYKNSDGDMNIKYTIEDVSDKGTIVGICEFSPTELNKEGKSGSFNVVGEINPDNMYMKLRGEDWIEKAEGYRTITMSGYVDVEEEKFQDPSYKLEIVREDSDTEESPNE